MNDYKKFCMNCYFNDGDYGCVCPSGEEVFQCKMYMNYHPEEVEKFNKEMKDWVDCIINDIGEK